MTARDLIAQAVTGAAGVTCSPYYRLALAPGEAFVRRGRVIPAENGFGHLVTWQVWVALPQDLTTAEKWTDEYAGDLLDALDAELNTVSLTPAELVLTPGGPSIPGLILEGAREG